jgi:hypothetical protein
LLLATRGRVGGLCVAMKAQRGAHKGKNDDPHAPQSLHKFTSSPTSSSTITPILAKAQNPVLGNISSDRVADNGRRASQ